MASLAPLIGVKAGSISVTGQCRQLFYALIYMVLFLIPLWPPTFWSATGLAARGVSGLWYRGRRRSPSFPIIEVHSDFLFAVKIIATVLLANAIGAALYMAGNRRARLRAELRQATD